jgi:pimeloyl-ACP methyl ester carboxylesterase
MSIVSRHYVTVDGRAVHYRVAGTGPLLLLLHQSPQSSADFLDLMGRWGDRYTMIAPDRPGCGCSEPLAIAAPSFEDYAHAVLRFMDALGLGRVPVYGFHTGASEAIALADLAPERVAAVAANGVVSVTPEELADIDANYLPPFIPRWDGGHLAWLWSRMREQTIFFPWHRSTAAARMKYDVPPPERLQKGALELLRCSETYHIAYRAAFHFDPHPALHRLRVPMLITAAMWDPLAAHLERLPRQAANLALRRAGSALEAESFASDFLAPFASPAPSLAVPATSAAGSHRLLLGDDFAVHAEEWGASDAPLVVLLHDACARARTISALGQELATQGFRVLAPDLPGHGESSPLGALADDVLDHCASRLAECFDSRVRGPAALLGIGAGAHVALALAARWRGQVARVVAHMPCIWPAEERAAIEAASAEVPRPDWFGGHLQYAWHRSRDAALFHPWCSRRHASAWSGEPQVDPRQAHERAVALLLCAETGPAMAAAAARDDFGLRLSLGDVPVAVTIDPRTPTSTAAAIRGACDPTITACEELPVELAGQAAAFSRLLRPGS